MIVQPAVQPCSWSRFSNATENEAERGVVPALRKDNAAYSIT